jgi:hypothetical protein
MIYFAAKQPEENGKDAETHVGAVQTRGNLCGVRARMEASCSWSETFGNQARL